MRLNDYYSIDSLYKITRMVNAGFSVLFFLSYPVYFITYYILFNGYLVYEGAVFIQDSLYCISYCKKWCLGIILLGNILTIGTYSCVSMFSSYYLAKCASYIVSIMTLPILAVILFLSLHVVFGTLWSDVTEIIKTTITIVLSGVLISLMPPFCRRRAHTLAGILLSGMNAFKTAIRTILWDLFYLSVIPVVVSIGYLLILWCHRSCISSIFISDTAEFMHRFITITAGAFIRIHFTEAVFQRTFKIDSMQVDRWSIRYLFLYVVGVVYGAVSTVLSTDYKSIGFISSGLMSIFFYGIRIVFLYWVPYWVIKIYRGFEKASVTSDFNWIVKNKQHFMYFEVCRHITMLFITLLPMCIAYYIFERYHGTTPSEISITISFMRMTFSYLFNGLDGSMIVVYIGQRLSLPQTTPKRVTYTDIVHVYKPSNPCAVHSA